MIAPLLMASLLAASAPAGERPKIIVLDLTAAGGVEKEQAGAVTEAIASEIAGRGFYDVVTSREVETLLGLERQKQLLGCSDDAASCLAELSGALGARFVMSGSVARLGEAYQLSVQTLDSDKAQTVGRSTKLARDLATLRGMVPWAVAEATGTPLPAPPSRVLNYTLIGAGALLAVGGGIVGQSALSDSARLQGELNRGQDVQLPETHAFYEEQKRSLEGRGVVALAGVAAGVALIASGILTMPADSPAPSGSAALVPSGNGLALVGTFP